MNGIQQPIGKPHVIIYPQDGVKTYVFPSDSGRILNEEEVQALIDAGGGGGGLGFDEIRRISYLTNFCK